MLPLMAPGIAIAVALVFVMSFAVFPSAILLGQPAGSTRTIAIAAYHQAFEHYDMSYASAIAVIMGLCQLAGLVLIVLVRQRMIMAHHHGRRETVKSDEQCADRLWSLALYLFLLGFILNLLGIVTHVTVSAFAKRWFGTPLPPAFTTDWFVYAWTNFELGRVLFVTVFIALVGRRSSRCCIAFPAAYILARRNFRGKPLLLLLYFLPLVIPQMTYGISLATTLYGFGRSAGRSWRDFANLVPMVPLAVFVLIPFFEQISLNLEWGAQTLGASRLQIFRRILLPPTRARHSDSGSAGSRQYDLEFRADVSGLRRGIADAGRRALSTTCSRAASGRSIRSMPWR